MKALVADYVDQNFAKGENLSKAKNLLSQQNEMAMFSSEIHFMRKCEAGFFDTSKASQPVKVYFYNLVFCENFIIRL